MTRLLLLILACLLAHGPGTFARGEDNELRWRGESLSIDALPDDLPHAARVAVLAWADWTADAGYRQSLDHSGRVLYITWSNNSKRDRHMKLIEAVSAHFEAVLPEPTERMNERDVLLRKQKPTGDLLPEDPELEEHPWDRFSAPKANEGGTEFTTWGDAGVPPDAETVVFLALRTQNDYGGALRFLVERDGRLAEWANRARHDPGFLLSRPPVAVYVSDFPRQEEWNADNEVVNRVARLILQRRFGQLPFWIAQGFGWQAEREVCGDIYCFPFRTGFVGVEEHKGWRRNLKARFSARPDTPLRVEEFAGWERGTYSPEEAQVSWGVVDHLVANHADALSDMLEEIRATRDVDSRIYEDEHTWKLDPDYSMSLKTQKRILEAHLGADLWNEVTQSFARGR